MDLQYLNAPLSDFLFHVWPNVSHWLLDLNFRIKQCLFSYSEFVCTSDLVCDVVLFSHCFRNPGFLHFYQRQSCAFSVKSDVFWLLQLDVNHKRPTWSRKKKKKKYWEGCLRAVFVCWGLSNSLHDHLSLSGNNSGIKRIWLDYRQLESFFD